MPINNIIKFQNDCSTNREVIDRKPIFSEKLHERSLCQGERSPGIELSLRIMPINNILKAIGQLRGKLLIGNGCVYGRTDGQGESSIPPQTRLRGV